MKCRRCAYSTYAPETNQYLGSYRVSQAAALAAAELKRQEQASREADSERIAYEAHRRKQAARLFETCQPAEQGLIREQAHRKASTFKGSLRVMMESSYIVSITTQRRSDQLDTFKEWKATRASWGV